MLSTHGHLQGDHIQQQRLDSEKSVYYITSVTNLGRFKKPSWMCYRENLGFIFGEIEPTLTSLS